MDLMGRLSNPPQQRLSPTDIDDLVEAYRATPTRLDLASSLRAGAALIIIPRERRAGVRRAARAPSGLPSGRFAWVGGEHPAGSRAVRSEVRRRQYGRPTRVGDVALTVARRVEVCGVRRMI